jgi:Lipoprotein NlpI, contains TPR repeats
MKSKEKILVHKGIDRVKREQFDDALEFFDRVLEMNPENADALNNKGVALYHMNRPTEALKCYDQALSADPENLEALRNKGFVLRSMQRFEEALEAYDLLIAVGPGAADLRNKAVILVGMGRPEEALGILMEAAMIEPSTQIEREIEMLRKMLLDLAMRAEDPPR